MNSVTDAQILQEKRDTEVFSKMHMGKEWVTFMGTVLRIFWSLQSTGSGSFPPEEVLIDCGLWVQRVSFSYVFVLY